jgi:hypothetical protein
MEPDKRGDEPHSHVNAPSLPAARSLLLCRTHAFLHSRLAKTVEGTRGSQISHRSLQSALLLTIHRHLLVLECLRTLSFVVLIVF